MNKNAVKIGKFIGAFAVILLILFGLVMLAKLQDNPAQSSTETLPAVTEVDHITGNPDGTVTMVEYSDFECPACKSYQPLVVQLLAEYGDRVRFVYRHFPIYSKHPNAEVAARAAEAAGNQGKFFEYGQILFDHQDDWASLSNPFDKFVEYATALSLNIDEFKADYSDSASKKAVDTDYQGGMQAGVSGTPTFFLDGVMLQNPQSYKEFTDLIDAEIEKVNTVPTATIDANGTAKVDLTTPQTTSTK